MVLKECAPVESSPLELADLPIPEPREAQILLRVEVCGVCHTDLHMVEGELSIPQLPIIPGHQIVGRVEKLGPEAKRFSIGDRVGVAWLYSTCQVCEHCTSGRENLCESARFTGLHVNGGYAELALAEDDFVYAIPEGFPPDQVAPLLCAGIIGYRALHLSELKPGERLGLYGFGASAHLAIQVARHWGCEVFVFTRSAEHQALARRLGAAWVGRSEDAAPAKLNHAIIFAPAGELVRVALEALDRGGVLALAGIHMSPIPQLDYAKHLYFEKTVRSVTASTRQDGLELLRLAAKIPLRPKTQIFPLEEANRALQLLKRRELHTAGVLQLVPI